MLLYLFQIVLMGEESHHVLAIASSDQLYEAFLPQAVESGKEFWAVPCEGFEQRSAKVQVERYPVLFVKVQDSCQACLGAGTAGDRADAHSVVISVCD